jgi:aspartate/tyrosine/aromatic aminotransferase
MSLEFGKKVYEESLKLKEGGRDANQIAKILFGMDPDGYNYGIGVILGGDGKSVMTSPTLLEYATEELTENSSRGDYMNSAKILEQVRIAALKWQRIPEEHWPRFKIALPSDAGTGAVKTAVEIGLMLDAKRNYLGIEELGWPAYKAIARSCRVAWKEFDADGPISGEGVLPVYQSGPMNTTGQVKSRDLVQTRAKIASGNDDFVVLDRAYSGFEFARHIGEKSYDEVMKMSYELQLKPFIEQGALFAMALSPTKSFVTFALRPCGILLICIPDKSCEKDITSVINKAMRARGSSFEHPITRALARALAKDSPRLEAEHKSALERLAEAEGIWKKLVKGTPIEYLYSENYAGLFRNPRAKEEAPVHIYNEHIYPVFAQNRCRQNITGIPSDIELAQKHVKVFAEYCF